MENRRQIVHAVFTDMFKLSQSLLAGVEVKYREEDGEIKTLWVDKACSFSRSPAGISVERQFIRENAGQGFKVFVTPNSTGTVTLC